MAPFINENFALQNETAFGLYHNHAKALPVIDYHCHLDPRLIAEDYHFNNLGELWLGGDHYKWRAMRTHGIDERYITGKDTSDWEKFEKWAETVPYTMRNPLYHWTHLELATAFGITKLLSPATAREIYDECSEKLRMPAFSARGLMKYYCVETVCTTDAPTDTLAHHIRLQEEGFKIKVLPTWRPDKAMAVESAPAFRIYVEQLAEISDTNISNYTDFLDALRLRHNFFAGTGCKLSDHGLEEFYAEDYTQAEVFAIYNKVYGGTELTPHEARVFKSAMLFELAVMDWEKGWTQQFHYGPLRNNNTRLFKQLGTDAGFDSIGDLNVAKGLAKFLDRLASAEKLTKTILYNLNPRDNEMLAAMIGNFQDGSFPGKIQFGSGWWFLDQKRGMEAQMNALSNQGLLSHFVGMLTDSRSFLSYPRHEYFRRILCNLIGTDVEQGLLPKSELPFLERMVENISYYNAKQYFEF